MAATNKLKEPSRLFRVASGKAGFSEGTMPNLAAMASGRRVLSSFSPRERTRTIPRPVVRSRTHGGY